MPSRPFRIGIVLFWVVITAWLIQRDIVPRISSDDPPAIAVNLVDEAPKRGGASQIRWTVLQNEIPVGRLRTWVEYERQEDVFRIHGQLNFTSRPRNGALGMALPMEFIPRPVMVDEAALAGTPSGRTDVVIAAVVPRLPEAQVTFPVNIRSYYQVTLDSKLKMLSAEMKTEQVQDSILDLPPNVDAHILGSVEEQYFTPSWWYQSQEDRREGQLEPFPVSSHGAVLNPLQPLHRIPGLYDGQRWRMPFIDPFTLLRLKDRPEVQILEARVSETLMKGGRSDVACFLVEQRSPATGTLIRTWVRQLDEMVLQQDVKLGDLELRFRRMTFGP